MKKLMAFSRNKKGKCDNLLRVVNLDETQIAVLTNELNETKQTDQQVINDILARLKRIELELAYNRGDIDKETYNGGNNND